jgi:acyl-CoA synthetase (AMP-forming)/AMP-acid ligase II
MISTARILSYRNLVEALLDKEQSDQGITFIETSGDVHLKYRDILVIARRILGNLQSRGLKPGDELVVLLRRNRDFVAVFWACLLGGIIPVPLTFPENTKQLQKVLNVWEVLYHPFLITAGGDLLTIRNYAEKAGVGERLDHLCVKTVWMEDMVDSGAPGNCRKATETEIAFIQFSSGSTNDPKGVVLSHQNLLANIRGASERLDVYRTRGGFLSWMPLTHDLGLIGFHLWPLVTDCSGFIMPPGLFLRNPVLWLKKIAQYRPCYSTSPNFGYKHLLKFLNPEPTPDLDLSSLQAILNGAEPVSARICHEFIKKTKPCGLKPTALMPAYGLAEASLVVSLPEPGREIVEVYVDRESLGIGARIRELDRNDAAAVCFVEVGKPIAGCLIRIVDERGVPLKELTVGGIRIKGENVTRGYYNNPAATSEAISVDGWLDTGDIGFLRHGYLFITGRSKDLISVNGNTYYANDIELVCEELEGFAVGKVAVCGIYNPGLMTEEILCFVQFRSNPREFSALAHALTKLIAQRIGVGVSRVIPVKQIPVTTSGKIQRYKLKEAYLKGEYAAVIHELALL